MFFIILAFGCLWVCIGTAQERTKPDKKELLKNPSSRPDTREVINGTINEVAASADVNIILYKTDLKAITFTSDHGLMRDNNSDFSSSGSVFSEPEWVPVSRNYPISHTMDSNVKVKLEFEILPVNLPSTIFNIIGTGTLGLNFNENVNLSGGSNFISITASERTERKIQKIMENISWVVSLNNSICTEQVSDAHTIYSTLGTPRNDDIAKHRVTQKRMARAVEAASGANSLYPFDIVKKVIQDPNGDGILDEFDLNLHQPNAWLVPDNGGDCQSIVRFAEKVAKMVNVPGTFDHKNIYAIEEAPTTAIEVDHPGGLNNPRRYHPLHPRGDPNGEWRLALIDRNGGCNNFEATGKFTYAGQTKYYAGGTTLVRENPDDILTLVFDSLSWIAFEQRLDENGDPVLDENGDPIFDCVIKEVVHIY